MDSLSFPGELGFRYRVTYHPSRRTMKQTNGITLPATFVVTVSHPGAEVSHAVPPENDILTVAELASLLKCKVSSIYNMTRHRGKGAI